MNTPSSDFEAFSSGMANAAELAGNFTVMVNARRRMPASGIVFSPNLVITANHVVEREEDAQVTLFDGKTVSAVLAGRDPVRDIALLRLKETVSAPTQPDATLPRVGQIVLALGRPDSDGIQASLGVISAIGGPVRTGQGGLLEKYLRTDTTPLPGFSGGPLVASNGQILGMNTSGLAMGALITIPAGLLWSTAGILAEHGRIPRTYLGIRSQAVTLGTAQQAALNSKQETGLLLVNIEENSPALKSGLLVGDILVGINQQPVTDHDDLQSRLAQFPPSQPVALDVLRGGKLEAVQVVLAER